MKGIRLVPITKTSIEVATFLSFSLAEFFDVPCDIIHEDIPISPYFNNERKQYHSTEILKRLLPFAKDTSHHVLGIVDVDLYIPILTFVYGEAQLGNRCALISNFRLHQQFYGLEQDQALLLQRSEKEAVHELGHTLGLVHCQNFECVMHFSNAVEYIDLKRATFCPDCSAKAGLPQRWK